MYKDHIVKTHTYIPVRNNSLPSTWKHFSGLRNYITDLQAGIDKIPANNSICVVGDFNARHSTWWNGQATDEIGRALFDFASSNGLVQLVQGATRHPGGAAAAQLDLCSSMKFPACKHAPCFRSCPIIAQHC